jgi:hypothetical protein
MARVFYRHLKSNKKIPTSSPPTDRCDIEVEEEKEMEKPSNKYEIKKALKDTKHW